MSRSIFVQVASYRDPQLIPTLADLVANAARPDALRVVVCWQHGSDETLDGFLGQDFTVRSTSSSSEYSVLKLAYRNAVIELIDVPHMKSKGVCWARNVIQQHYRGEKYTLQLDSHHRFVERWDDVLVEMLESLRERSPKPVLTAYLPPFDPNHDPASRVMSPTVMSFAKLDQEGIVNFSSFYVGESEFAHPVPGCFYSAHFAFADGSFAVEVQHDPQYFHHGEENSIAVRAYTHGYDFYHPHRVVAWHQYGPGQRSKIWDDHTRDAKLSGAIEFDWCDYNDRSWHRHRSLFRVGGAKSDDGIDLGPYGFGTARSLDQYERFVGISYEHRAIHKAVLAGQRPPIGGGSADNDEAWLASLRRSTEIHVCVSERELGDLSAAATATLRFFDADDAELHHDVLDGAKVKTSIASGRFDYTCVFLTELGRAPVRYTFELTDNAGHAMNRLERGVGA
ncbi:GlcNAc-transferase family protein [Trinickia sp. EG282A]|uniref:GlcNAc-transferase family protein n=1 Tax=Trinickia sp. EG282A TaxID=3237013 RepID=UPI0034D1764F